jgi:hypothetical protein
VVKSNIRQNLILAGNIEGSKPDEEKIANLIVNILSQPNGASNNQTIYHVDES